MTLRKRRKLFAPAIVLTGHQIAGRGRGSNSWWSGAGSLTVTFVLPVQEHRLPHQIPLLAGLAVRNAIAAHSGIDDVQLKWPNDLLHHGRKLAGLLCERVDRVDLIGLGLNVNVKMSDVPRPLRQRVTSLAGIAGVSFDMTLLLADIAHALHQNLSRRDEPPFAQMLREYDRHHALVGKRVSITNVPGEPPLNGIGDRARLNGTIAFERPIGNLARDRGAGTDVMCMVRSSRRTGRRECIFRTESHPCYTENVPYNPPS